jgi:2-dehydro-3-deoxygalactonokinase
MTGEPAEAAVPCLIGVDWGSSRLRAYALAANGRTLARVESDAGVLRVRRGELADALSDLLTGWKKCWPTIPIIASGMIGSRDGLTEVPYVDTPAKLQDVREGMATIQVTRDLAVAVVPGLAHRGGHSVDVMRGEETAILGWLRMRGCGGDQTLILPGTHSKWVHVAAGKITEFCTFPTGELFDSLLRSGSLKNLAPVGDAPGGPDAFHEGLMTGLSARGLLHDYFSIRAEAVAGPACARDIHDRLSGLLIGYELAEARSRSILVDSARIVIVGDGTLARNYARALAYARIPFTASGSEALPQGWLALADG